MTSASHRESRSLRIGIIDTGVNPWHSHVRGAVSGMRIFLDDAGKIREDEDFRDLVGHGTAVAGILRQGLPETELFVVRVFDETLDSYPSLVARALLRAAAEGCRIINLSLGMPPGPGAEVLEEACRTVQEAGCLLVAAGHPDRPGLLPAVLPGVIGVIADDRLHLEEITMDVGRIYPYSAAGRPRDLEDLSTKTNFWGNSFACARVTSKFAQRTEREHHRTL
ncbi:MAG: S8 family serine peptidase [Desulfuromonadales bacterium]|nr:S8 family serine peptidase [Desulfuromonadales bacterium]